MKAALFYYVNDFFYKDLRPLKLLIELGVDLNSENAEGIAAIHFALEKYPLTKDMVALFIAHKADLSKTNKAGKKASEILGQL